MVVGVFHVRLPELHHTLDVLSGLSVRLSEMRCCPSSRPHAFFWVRSSEWGSGDALEEVLAEDLTVRSAQLLLKSETQRLYRIDFAGGSKGLESYEALVDLNGSILEARSSDGSWTIKVFFPRRRDLSEFYDRCRTIGLEPELTSLTITHDVPPDREYGLTAAQRHTLVVAARRGYFSVPKETSLVRLADDLGVSDQAVSERLRRGMDRLVRNTLLPAASEEGEEVLQTP
jgi:predicted DNA binding protein